jgi:hypothetical protein
MKRFLLAATLIAALTSCEEAETVKPDPKQVTISNGEGDQPSSVRSYKLIFTEDIGWGYQVFEGSKMLVDQKHIPAVQGMVGFETKEKAEITAEFVLNKIENGIFPPTVSPEELDSLGVYSPEKN